VKKWHHVKKVPFLGLNNFLSIHIIKKLNSYLNSVEKFLSNYQVADFWHNFIQSYDALKMLENDVSTPAARGYQTLQGHISEMRRGMKLKFGMYS